MGVMYTCAALAMVYDYDLEDAQAAGLLHDSAKCIPNKKKLKLCSQHDIPVSDFEKDHPFLLHAKLGAYVASSKYDIKDEEILTAITYHTTGRPGMSLLEKIVYISDYIEPMRDKAPNLAKVRKIAFEDLDECMYEILKENWKRSDNIYGQKRKKNVKWEWLSLTMNRAMMYSYIIQASSPMALSHWKKVRK